MSNVTVIEGKDLEGIINSNANVLVNFSAAWCGPCKGMAPALEQVAAANPQVKIVKLDIDVDFELAAAYKVRAVPTLILFKDTQVVASVSGAQTKGQLEKLIAE